MKKNYLLLALFAAVILFFASCSKDNNVSIVGTWRWEDSVTIIYIDGEYYDARVVNAKDEGEGLLEFSADGTMTYLLKAASGIQTLTGTYKVIENIVILNLNKLGINDEFVIESETMTIESLTSSSLILSSEVSYTSAGKNYKSIGKSTYKRVK